MCKSNIRDMFVLCIILSTLYSLYNIYPYVLLRKENVYSVMCMRTSGGVDSYNKCALIHVIGIREV